jgi:hypothetical protein
LLVAVVAATAGLFALRAPTFTEDEYSLLIYADLIGRGRVPNRDFFTPYGPGTLWPITVANHVVGHASVIAERMVGLGYHVALAVGVWRLASHYGRRSSVVAGCLSGLIAAGLTLTAYGWIAALAATVWFIVLATDQQWFWSGVLAIVAITVRPEFVVVVAVCAMVLIRRRQPWLRFGLGILLGGIPLWTHLFLAGSSLARNVFLDRLAVNGRVQFPGVMSWTWVAFVGLLACLAVILARFARTPSRVTAAHALLALLVVPQALQRTDHDHIAFVAVLVVPIAVSVLLGMVDVARLGRTLDTALMVATRGAATLLVAFCLVVAAVAPRGDALVINDRRVFTFGPSASAEITNVIQAVESQVPSKETFFVGASDMSRFAVTSTYLYFLMPDRIPNAYYLELAPGVSERKGSRLIGDVRHARYLALTRVDPARERALYPYLPKGSEVVDRFVERHFCRSASAGEVDIYKRCQPTVSGGAQP